jgi:predicted secreted hydrolase
MTNRQGLLLFCLLPAACCLLAGCGSATTADRFPSAAPAQLMIPATTPGPVPGTIIRFPEDEAPHDVLTEWWYYTGHVITTDGKRYGVEFVIFQGSRASFPIEYAAHFAIIDAQSKTFTWEDAASTSSSSTPRRPDSPTSGFDLHVNSWTMRGLNGMDELSAAMTGNSRTTVAPSTPAAYAIQITATDEKGPVLEGGGQFSYGPGGSSYYYSRTRMRPAGTITIGGQILQIADGALWFDHQWGNFLPTAGGWDWFSTQLDDGSELMIYHLRDATGRVLQIFGEYVPQTGGSGQSSPAESRSTLPPAAARALGAEQFTITPTGMWTSPATGITYPSGWRVQIAAENGVPALDLHYNPVIPNAELDTRKTTGVTYWEGDTMITGTKNGEPITGSGYVELTGYRK